VGSRIDYAKLSNIVGIASITLKNYLKFLEDTYLIQRISVFTESREKEITKAQKLYFSDTGIANILADLSGGAKFENTVFNQIKHFGYRIEPEEIEIAINSLNEVEQTVVIYKRIKNAYGKLIAYIASKNINLDINKIKKDLSQILPCYMIPNTFIVLDHLPKNSNGKIDRNQLLMDYSQLCLKTLV